MRADGGEKEQVRPIGGSLKLTAALQRSVRRRIVLLGEAVEAGARVQGCVGGGQAGAAVRGWRDVGGIKEEAGFA